MSTPTEQEDWAAYHANRDWDDGPSLTKARAFKNACRGLVGHLSAALRSSHGGSGRDTTEVERELRGIEARLQHVEQWLSVNGSGATGRVTHADFRNFRD